MTTYKVRLNYAISVEANSTSEAYRKAAELIRMEPSIVIRGAELKGRDHLKALFFGY